MFHNLQAPVTKTARHNISLKMTTANLCIFTQNYRSKNPKFFTKTGMFPLLVPHQFPAPVGEGKGVGSALCFHTCYWRDIRAVFISLAPAPVIVYLREGDITDPTPAPPLQGRGVGCVSSFEAGN